MLGLSWRRAAPGILSVLLLGAGGCDYWHRTESDETREANYMIAYNYGLQGAYDDAVRAYYAALEANPKNATAHRELGFLFHEKKHDPVLAYYHFRRSQQIKAARKDKDVTDPTVDNAIKQCQIRLAIEFSGAIGQQQSQSQLDDLRRRNAELQASVADLRQRLAQVAAAGGTNLVFNAGSRITPPTEIVYPSPATNGLADSSRLAGANSPSRPLPEPKLPAQGATASPKAHVVRSGETPSAIARKYGITAKQLLAANPGVDSRRIHAGQSLNIPDKGR
jgi:LysM repeat protein